MTLPLHPFLVDLNSILIIFSSRLLDAPEGIYNLYIQLIKIQVDSDETMQGRGDNIYGQCKVPQGLKNVEHISTGDSHSVAVYSVGNIVAWGWGNEVECTIPKDLTGITSVTAGGRSTMFLKYDCTLIGVGYLRNIVPGQ